MTELWAFANNHWWISFWAFFWFMAFAVTLLHVLLFTLPNRILRTIKVLCRGWPPEHLDADGDWKPVKEDSTDE